MEGNAEAQSSADVPDRPQTLARDYSIHTYVNDSTSHDIVQPPEPIHAAEERTSCCTGRPTTLVTVRSRTSTPCSLSDNSSGLSVKDIEAPAPVLLDARTRQPGTYSVSPELVDLESASSTEDEKTVCDDKEAKSFTLCQIESYGDKIATKEHLQSLQDPHPLPDIEGHPLLANVRYRWMSMYRRLMLLVFAANIATIVPMIVRACRNDESFTYADAATATGANLLAAIMMRQEHVINMLFRLVCALPSSTPLCIKRPAAKIAYSQGGVHSAAGISALGWYILYTALIVLRFNGTPGEAKALAVVTALTVAVFVILIAMACPGLRRRFHDYWELSHRFGGWTAIALVWTQILISTISAAHKLGEPIGAALARTPTFWFLLLITLCLIYPWLWLRRLPVEAHRLSTHATELRFHNRSVKTCVGTALSHRPLIENHKFATIAPPPDSSGARPRGYSVLISHAGDWTKAMIHHPPQHIWQRGAPTTGVMRIASLFRPILVIATGSGIGPCLSFLNTERAHPCRVIWSARFPEETYGRDVFKRVLEADRDAVVIDTKKTGHPNLVALAYAMARRMGAEGVVIISNPKVTKEVVFGLEARKVPAFGAIFDS